MREKRNALLCGSLFLSLCQREIAALRALELHRITQNINMQIAFFREGNFISARNISFTVLVLRSSAVWGPVGANTNGGLGGFLNWVGVLLPAIHLTVSQLVLYTYSVIASYHGCAQCRQQVTC